MISYSIFDLIGPIMVGPSSSHTAGANRIGYITKHIIKKDIKEITFYLHGSFAKTYKGHGTDKALLAGIMGFLPDDERISNAFDYAKEKGITYRFIEADLGDVHPNTTKIEAITTDDEKWTVTGSSIGGGKVRIIKINEMDVDFNGEYTTILTHHLDYPGIVAKVTNILAANNINIAFMKLFREVKGKKALLLIETDEDIPLIAIEQLKSVEHIYSSKIIPKCNL